MLGIGCQSALHIVQYVEFVGSGPMKRGLFELAVRRDWLCVDCARVKISSPLSLFRIVIQGFESSFYSRQLWDWVQAVARRPPRFA